MVPGVVEIKRSRSLRRSQRWRWRLRAANGNIIATSGEGYSDKAHAIAMAEAIVFMGEYREVAMQVDD